MGEIRLEYGIKNIFEQKVIDVTGSDLQICSFVFGKALSRLYFFF